MNFPIPQCIIAPMVDQSELAWRILSRRYGATLCYTPMLHAKLFAENEKYRQEMFTTNSTDRPLIVQFCANDPEILLKAAKMVENDCDAVDINLGCPQHIAKRGRYGSFLMDEWELIKNMIDILSKNLKIPVTVKIRIFPQVEKSIQYAKMIEAAGCKLLTVHGRTREQKGHNTGLADWTVIKAIKEALSIPVIANGNILYYEDIQQCIHETGVDGVMIAEANLYNPTILSEMFYPVTQIGKEYLTICKQNPTSATLPMIRAHMFKIFKPCLSTYTEIRERFAHARELNELLQICSDLEELLINNVGPLTPKHRTEFEKNDQGYYVIPSIYCQPYIRVLNPEANAQIKQAVNAIPCKSCPNMSSSACPNVLCKGCCLKNDAMTCESHLKRKKIKLEE